MSNTQKNMEEKANFLAQDDAFNWMMLVMGLEIEQSFISKVGFEVLVYGAILITHIWQIL